MTRMLSQYNVRAIFVYICPYRHNGYHAVYILEQVITLVRVLYINDWLLFCVGKNKIKEYFVCI